MDTLGFFIFSCLLNIKEQKNDCINNVSRYGNKIKKIRCIKNDTLQGRIIQF
jgi:hypothetical protein